MKALKSLGVNYCLLSPLFSPGIAFEGKILEQQQGNPRFNFLRPNDPYNAYYKWKVSYHFQSHTAADAASDSHAPRGKQSKAGATKKYFTDLSILQQAYTFLALVSV